MCARCIRGFEVQSERGVSAGGARCEESLIKYTGASGVAGIPKKKQSTTIRRA